MRSHFATIILIVSFLGLAGCQVSPLYKQGGFGGPQSDLARVDVEEIDSRIGLKLRNELRFSLTGGGEAPAPDYRLKVIISKQETSLAVQKFADVPDAKSLRVAATFILAESRTGKTIHTGSSFVNASFDYSNQEFANRRATREAEDRAAVLLAQDIHARLATVFAERKL